MSEALLFQCLTSAAALTVCVRMLVIANLMNGTTDHGIRLAGVLLAVSALGVVFTPLYAGAEKWTEPLFAFGVAAWVFAEKRRNWT